MRLLVDENLSVRIVNRLEDAEHDAVHVIAVGLGNSDDEVILRSAADNQRVVVTADADFSTILALQGMSQPSVLMLRSSDHLAPDQQADLILLALGRVGEELERGAIASVAAERIRVRFLPITSPPSSPPH